MRSPSLAFGGVVVVAFGFFLSLAGLPFGFAFFGAGIVMLVLSFILKPPPPVGPEDPTKKLCWFCMREIHIHSEACPYCKMRQ